ncbi:hypothetical protein [Sinanaerobacter sp. ZZT-01]|uniref:hypothetical protein n=1 Tax=Sinanaerobacter sp. ZZT-01 TaxID=3111540 RepID=UPI002D7698D9|nr:hypothetical protein [Sinanaerobacter sp. ZZT-01]WRR92998.1 hypothetical protein U5921_13295 [Sinanaerobacter sp. ZZT-01]
MDKYDKIDELLEETCYIVDFLPQRVPKNSEGQYFKIEEYFRKNGEMAKLYQKFADILLKINCYYDFDVSYRGSWTKNPLPEELADWIKECTFGKKDYMNILIEDESTMIVVNGDDLYLSCYNLNEKMKSLLGKLAAAEGLFLWNTKEDEL